MKAYRVHIAFNNNCLTPAFYFFNCRVQAKQQCTFIKPFGFGGIHIFGGFGIILQNAPAKTNHMPACIFNRYHNPAAEFIVSAVTPFNGKPRLYQQLLAAAAFAKRFYKRSVTRQRHADRKFFDNFRRNAPASKITLHQFAKLAFCKAGLIKTYCQFVGGNNFLCFFFAFNFLPCFFALRNRYAKFIGQNF